jgi:hypothetical protein
MAVKDYQRAKARQAFGARLTDGNSFEPEHLLFLRG